MADIHQIDDLIRCGRLHADTLVLEPDVKLRFINDITIPFALKISGNTSFQGTVEQPTIEFKTKRPALCCSSAAEYFTVANLDIIGGNSELFKFRRNNIRNITFLNTAINAMQFGELSTRSLNLIHTSFKNSQQRPIVLEHMNTITICDVEHDSKYPLFDLSNGKSIRDNITVHGMDMKNQGGLLVIGDMDSEGLLDMSNIPKLGITVNDINMPNCNLLKVRRTDGRLVSLSKDVTTPYFL